MMMVSYIEKKGGIVKFQSVQSMAKAMGVPIYRRKKVDLIRVIQTAEGNLACFGTERVAICEEGDCLWRQDCLSLSASTTT
jgi:hypothetical protein